MVAAGKPVMRSNATSRVLAERTGVREIKEILQDVLAQYNLPTAVPRVPVVALRWTSDASQMCASRSS
jgi:hypothetical protein